MLAPDTSVRPFLVCAFDSYVTIEIRCCSPAGIEALASAVLAIKFFVASFRASMRFRERRTFW